MTRGLPLLALLAVAGAVALSLRSDDARRYELVVANAGQLVSGGEVQMAGVRVGSIVDIGLTPDHRALITVAVDRRFGPLRRGTTAEIRATSLSGVANRTIALRPPPPAAAALAGGARLPVTAVEGIVDLDQLVAMLDRPTRVALRSVISGSARASAGGREAMQRITRFLSPALSQATAMAAEIGGSREELDGALVGLAETSTAVARESAAVGRLVVSTGTLLTVAGRRSGALGNTARALPGVVIAGRRALSALRRMLPAVQRLTAVGDAHRRDVEVAADAASALLRAAGPAASDVARAVDRPGTADLLAATRGLPRLARDARPAAAGAIRLIPKLTPILADLRLYSPDLVNAFGGLSRVSGYYDANGNFARIAPAFNAFRLAAGGDGPGVLVPREQPDPLDGMHVGQLTRCPGAGVVPPDDGSAPDRGDPPIDCAAGEHP